MDSYRRYKGTLLDGRYQLEDPVGIGGMAVVFSAIDKMTGRRVAVKMLRDSAASDPKMLKRFLIESRTVSMFNHNNIVKIYDVSVDGPFKYIVMEYIDGVTLREYMDYKRQIDWRDAIIYIDQVLRALDHAHNKGVVHRDIKPSNIMLLEGGFVKVMDFGIAKVLDGKSSTLTANTAIGTVYYISPEQANSGNVNWRSDIYSVGCMLYEMVTGKLPFTGETPVAVAMKQIKEDPVPPSQINPRIPLGLEQVILCAMQKDPNNRYQSASQMLRHIRQLQSDPTTVFVMRKPTPKTPTSDVVMQKTTRVAEQNAEYYNKEQAPSYLNRQISEQRAPENNAPQQHVSPKAPAYENRRAGQGAQGAPQNRKYTQNNVVRHNADAPHRTSMQNTPPLREPERIRGDKALSMSTILLVFVIIFVIALGALILVFSLVLGKSPFITGESLNAAKGALSPMLRALRII
ncbi:MAG: serine/threonine protein kinase [Clostridiales bacterium]|nr:serine/threonine protein kinase [Clostridiales bacterium]